MSTTPFRSRTLFVCVPLLLGLACAPPASKDEPGGTGGKGGSGTAGKGGGGAGGGGSGGAGGMMATAGTGGGGTGGGGTGGTPMSGAVLPLPLVVSTHFDNQGWFGDEGVSKSFTAGSMTIKQAESSMGLCGQRQAAAKGKCYEITYTPPAGYMPPLTGSGYAGVFFLTTIAAAHTDPPAKPGDANWGIEPGKNVEAGATKISFFAGAAADSANFKVAFKAGTGPGDAKIKNVDKFAVAETPQTLTTAWAPYSLPITGTYENGVVGGFAWVITDPSKAAHFFLDGIVWEK